MTEPTVPLRVDLEFQLDATPEQVWDAIATANGLSGWFLPTDGNEGEGGVLNIHMGEYTSRAEITAWEPAKRLEYAEPDWPTMVGKEGVNVSPMVSEFIIEAKSGGTSVMRVVTSAFGTGDDWEQEFFDDMVKSWVPYFRNLEYYLANFAGQKATPLNVSVKLDAKADDAWQALKSKIGTSSAGQPFEAKNLKGQVEEATDSDPRRIVLRVTDPSPALLWFQIYESKGSTTVSLEGALFAADAPSIVESEKIDWEVWLKA